LLEDDMAIVNIGGVKKHISIALIDDLQPGDFVIMHVGYALNKIDPEEAAKTLELFKEIGVLEQAIEEHNALGDS
ncbi:MAG: HypC/HybG/HupF family hydrogenase formation chaperone, partial [Colwellia sp.]|nr:HypC/HybG/HupF family hydrogenase formation chaperone [Colwellia sp.]